MNNLRKFIFPLFMLLPAYMSGQDKPTTWDLNRCIDYALAHNIQVKKSQVSQEEGLIDTKQAKAQLFPSLSFGSSHSYTNRPMTDDGMGKNSYNGTYNLNSSWTLYDGNSRVNEIRQRQIQNRVDEYNTMRAEDDIELAITETYLQILYAMESVRINENTLELSQAQLERARVMYEAGSISESDFAQFEAQCSTDQYQVVVAQTSVDEMKLQLKQLLELDIDDEMELTVPELNEADVLKALPTKQQVYQTALEVMPQIQSSRLAIDLAKIGILKAKSGYLPSLTLNASIGTGSTNGGDAFSRQLKNKFNESIALTLSVPIFNNRNTKSAVEKAKLAVVTSELDLQDEQKSLLKTVEGVYLDAVSSQTRYRAAAEQITAVEKSYRLVEEQYFLGMKNPVELMTEKNKLQQAKQEAIQSKYMAILNLQLLNFYQHLPIQL